MDFQALSDSMHAMTCVVSVERLEGGGYGKIRFVTGNRAWLNTIERPAAGQEMLTTKFVPNSEYTNYLTRDLNFEDYCYRAAVQKKCLHSYAHPDRMDVWFNMTFLPVAYEEGDTCYCTYTMEINLEPSTERLANVSEKLAASVLEGTLMLRGAKDFKSAMGNVIQGIRELCEAQYCCILLMNERERSCEVLCESIEDGSGLLPMEAYLDDGFYDIAESWTDVIAGSNCLIAKNEHDMDVVRERNPRWHASLMSAGIQTIVLFPLKHDDALLGYIWAVNFDPVSSGRIKETFELSTFILASEIYNQLLLEQLRVLSSRDMLTGLLNRNEMESFINELCGEDNEGDAPVGIVFADLNGLKRVNDFEGHAAGDALLKNATAVLREAFGGGKIFRAGGDEFTIIVPGVTQDELDTKVSAAREAAKRHGDVSIAFGSCCARGARDIGRALKVADERMYDDKRRHYEHLAQ